MTREKLAALRQIAEAYRFELAATKGWGSDALDAAQDAFDEAFDADGVLELIAALEVAT